MKADALMHFILSGNRALEHFAVVLARISLGVFFAISGGNKLFVAGQYKLMYETIGGAGIPFPQVLTYFVSSVEFVCGCLLIIGLLPTLCCIAFIIDKDKSDQLFVNSAARPTSWPCADGSRSRVPL